MMELPGVIIICKFTCNGAPLGIFFVNLRTTSLPKAISRVNLHAMGSPRVISYVNLRAMELPRTILYVKLHTMGDFMCKFTYNGFPKGHFIRKATAFLCEFMEEGALDDTSVFWKVISSIEGALQWSAPYMPAQPMLICINIHIHTYIPTMGRKGIMIRTIARS